MTHTLPAFAARVRCILQEKPGPAGREQVAAQLQTALLDRPFIETLFDATSPERKVLHEDAELGFCILAHRYTGAKAGSPHDHGTSWAIYGQADGETMMSDWTLIEAATPGRPGKVRKLREYTLTPGIAHLYDEGAIHAPSRSGPTRLVRIEGKNLERIPRGRYEPE